MSSPDPVRRAEERTMPPFSNELSLAQSERLALLAEECGEIIQAVGKILRHGYRSKNPLEQGYSLNNRERLAREIGDLQAALDLMLANDDIDEHEIETGRLLKRERVVRWLHHQQGCLP